MDFGARPPRPRGESVVPMINVVFLLLIFFLMTATIVPPDPFESTPPEASTAETAERGDTLHIGPDGALAFGPARGEAALAAVPAGSPLLIRADAGLAAAELSRILSRLAAAGVTDIRLAAVAR
jgi:biopolymer transport protein ExbD